MWLKFRFFAGNTWDDHKNQTQQVTIPEEEQKKMKEGALVIVEGQKRLTDEILTRKKLKQSYEYEVSFKNMSSSENIWIPRDDLIKRGFEKVSLLVSSI